MWLRPLGRSRRRNRPSGAPTLLCLLSLAIAPHVGAQGLTDIASYPTSGPTVFDVSVGPTGTVYVLKGVPLTTVMLVERTDREGTLLGSDLSLTGGTAPAPQRIAAGPGDDVFVLTDAPGATERRIVRLTPGQGNATIASYPMIFPGSTPIDISMGVGGELLILKRVSNALLVERRNRTGAILGPDLAISGVMMGAEFERIAGAPNGDIFVRAEVSGPPTFTIEPTIFRLAVGSAPVPILSFDTSMFFVSFFDVSLSLDGDLLLLRTDDNGGTSTVIDRYDRDGNPLSVPFPAANGFTQGSSLAGGMGNDVFSLGAFDFTGEPVLRRLTLVQAIAELVEYDPFASFITPVDLASDDSGNVVVLKSDGMSLLLIERRDRDGFLLGPELGIVNPLGFSPARIATGAGLDLFVLADDLMNPGAEREILRVSELESPTLIVDYPMMSPQPVDVGSDSAGGPVVLTIDPAMPMAANVERRDRDGVVIGTPVVVPASGVAMPGPRIAGGAAGDAFVLATDPNDPNQAKLLYRVPPAGPAVPIQSFNGQTAIGIPVAVDVATDHNGDVLVMLTDDNRQQVTVERYDPSGTLIEAVGAAPGAQFGGMGEAGMAAGLFFDRFVLQPNNSGFAVLLYRLAMADQDGDGIPDDGDFSLTSGDAPCTGGATALCDDNCPLTPNTDQNDVGGLATLSDPTGFFPDGVGTACQCTDTSRDGSGNDFDVNQVRLELAGIFGQITAPEFCNVYGPVDPTDADANGIRDDCDLVDVVVATRAFAELAPGVGPVCAPALGL
jgi:hypothetical protein